MSEILIFAEIEEGDLHSTAGELIAAGRKISDLFPKVGSGDGL